MKTNNFFKIISLVFFTTVLLSSCNKDKPEDPIVTPPITIDNIVVSDKFNYEMTKSFNISISTKDIYGTAMPGVRVEIYKDYDEITKEGNHLLTGITNEQGVWETMYPIDFVSKKLYLVTGYIGLPSVTAVDIINNQIDVTIGGVAGTSSLKGSYSMPSINASYNYLCSFNGLGVPSCLITPRDVISAAMLADINAALPERAPVPTYHPEYLANSNQTDIRLLEAADVWVTFVHEGAGYRNTLGFYTYDIANPPTSKTQISLITIALPNVSFSNSGGGLFSGDKVYLGQFPAGTGIGWVLIADAYNGSQVVTTKPHYYSNENFNPETNAANKQHNVILYDAERQVYLIGFEDLNRNPGNGSDNDFNDAIFYVTSNPVEAIDNSNMPFVDPNLIDSDGDGVFDVMDDYPNDASRAFNNYYPGRLQQGSLAFEDLWPAKGDYDFNDLVLLYHINQITNAQNNVVDIVTTNTIQAIGAGYKNGFGFQLNLPSSAIASVTGFNHKEGIISLSSNNTEAGQSKATIIPFDNTYNLYTGIGSGYVNTREEMAYITPPSIITTIHLVTPQTVAAVGLPPYNPFIIIDKERGKEVHLPGYTPTDLVDQSYFGTMDDDSDPATGKYYKSTTNLPWAMNVPDQFDYPKEKTCIIDSHLVFGTWVQSSGFSYMDWYDDKSGYRNTANIYSKTK
jgi:LruC domain-containing protein